MTIRDEIRRMKLASPQMAASSADTRNRALAAIAKALEDNKEEIFAANREDMERAEETGVSASVKKRLRFDEAKLSDVLKGIALLGELEDPVGKTQILRQLDEGLVLRRVSCPIGVIGVIFEARPDAMVQISTLCIKSGNCAVLKGGRETACTNRAIFGVIKRAAVEAGLPEACLLQAEQHSEIDELLSCEGDVDLLIPRGSNAFVRYIMEHTKIPVMGHADGICHVYLDKDADLEKAADEYLAMPASMYSAFSKIERDLAESRYAHIVIVGTRVPDGIEAIANGCQVTVLLHGETGTATEANVTTTGFGTNTYKTDLAGIEI